MAQGSWGAPPAAPMSVEEPSRGAIVRICEGREKASDIFRPLLEVQDVRRLGNTDERFAVILSDGEFTMKGVFGMGPLYQQVNEGKVGLHCLIRLTEWYLVEIPSKRGGKPPSEVLTIANAEAAGFVPPERRVPQEALRKWGGGGGSAVAYTQATQAEPQRPMGGMHQPPQQQLQQQQHQFPPHTTSAPGTAPAPVAPWNAAAGQRQAPAAAWGAMGGGDSLAEAATQDQPLFAERPSAAPQPPAQNPYSAGVGMAAAAPSGQGYGLTAMPGAGPQASGPQGSGGGNLYSSGATAPGAAPGGFAQASTGPAPMGNAYGLSAQGAPQQPLSAAPAGNFAPNPYSAPGSSTGTSPGTAAPQSNPQYAPPLTAFPGFQAQPQQQPPPQKPQQQFPPGFGGFGGAPPQQQQSPQSFRGAQGMQGTGRAPATPATQVNNVMPLAGLSPYTNGRWKIKARITQKSDIRKFNNAKGEGQLFKVDLIDKAGSEMSATFFGRAVDRFFEMLRPQQVYYFSRGSVKMANKRFDKGEHVITFDEHTSIEAAEEDQEIPGVNYEFVPLANIDAMQVNETIDVKAVILEARDPFTVTLRKNNEERVKRELTLWDDSGAEGSSFLSMTVWGQHAHDNFEAGMVIYAKGVRVSEWNGSKSLNGSSGFELNPDSPHAFALQRKFEEKRPNQTMAGGPSRGSKMSGARESIEEIREADKELGPAMVPGQGLDPNGPRSTMRHVVLATLTHIPNDRAPFYAACPELVDGVKRDNQQGDPPKRTCNKKVTQNGSSWTCQSGHCCSQPMYRYLGNRVQVVDPTGSLEVSFFDEAGKQIFGCEANEIAEIWGDPTRDAEMQQRLAQLSWKRYLFRLTSKREMWQDEQRVRINCEEGVAPNLVKEGQRMLAEVKAALEAPVPAQDVMGVGGL